MREPDLRYLELLSRSFPTIDETLTEIINLEAILNLPKGTEHFLSDLHGEIESFEHVIRNGSGNVKIKINDLFSNRLTRKEMNNLATLVYYPEEKMHLILDELEKDEVDEWYRITLLRLIELTASAGSKFTRAEIRELLPKEFAYVIEELLSRDDRYIDKDDYYNEIIASMIELSCADEFIVATCYLIQSLIVAHVHVIGDIYDRGPAPEKIIDRLKKHKSADVQWGNHDIVWIGAALGSPACVANVLRIATRYDNLETIEDSYGISMRHLIAFAENTYLQKDIDGFFPRVGDSSVQDSYPHELEQLGLIQRAISIIQFKLEGQIIKRNPEFSMNDRLILDKINYETKEIILDGITYPLVNAYFPTIDPNDPYSLSEEEQFVMDRLVHSFTHSELLQDDVKFLIHKGSMYLVYNGNVLFHGCIPMDEDGNFISVKIDGREYSGRALLDKFDETVRRGYYNREGKNNDKYLDKMWYLWCGEMSPLFGKTAMKTLERYYIKDKATHGEAKNPYYHLREREDIAIKVLEEFGLDTKYGHVLNGHTPVKERKGENPVKANGRLLVIDGGYSPAYQDTTGLGGYTLLSSSHGMKLCVHEPFTSKEDAINNETDIVSTIRIVDVERERVKIKDTDDGKQLMQESHELKCLLKAYRSGRIKQKK